MERAFKEYYRRWKFRHPSIADLRETLAEVTGQRAVIDDAFARQVYAVTRVDDRIGDFTSTALPPVAGMHDRQADVDKRIDAAHTRWHKLHPHAPDGTGPYPYRTDVTVRRLGAPVPQTLVVKFADGSTETAHWDTDERWHTFTWTKTARAVSAELDPQRLHYLDVSKLDDSRTLEPDARASRRWGLEFAAVVEYLLSLIATL
jgi:hypothetical protein